MSKEISGRGRTRSRGVKGNQGVGDFRFINILQFFSIYYYYYYYYYLSFFPILFYPRHLPTPTPTTHTHDPRPLPTTHDSRHLATLSTRGRRRSRGVKGNQGVGDFRSINILQFFFYLLLLLSFYHFFLTFFTHDIYPHPHSRPTPTTHDLYPLPTTHDI